MVAALKDNIITFSIMLRNGECRKPMTKSNALLYMDQNKLSISGFWVVEMYNMP